MKGETKMSKKQYGLANLILDFILVLCTGGLWMLWIIIRFLRANS